ncbi:aminoglycoside phosphotransferase family protein [Microbacterium sp. B2969]|uniref:Aminoglycoside phosphotransferase family protein n=1 Tax=Microbacterium alkaliflavum TaxID=3248839 RepID=A0ABW7Q6Y4_9MICO
MPDMPAAEVQITAELVRAMLVSQASRVIPDAAALPLAKAASGWDCELWRLGSDLAVRLPRRSLAAPLVVHEQRVLPRLGPPIEATGIRVPVPVFAGAPGEDYPWAWSIVPWFHGVRGLDVPRALRGAWAEPVARALGALHVAADPDHPVNPVRGVPLAARAEAVAERLSQLRGSIPTQLVDVAEGAWSDGLAAQPWARPPVWIHGDLHPGNLIVGDERVAAIVDFGDVTAGDPAYDLAIAWLAFDATGRARFRAAIGDRTDAATWMRARAWAAAFAVLLLVQSDDNPDYALLGRETLEELAAERSGQNLAVPRTT